MAEKPKTRYARVGELSVAYQVFGEGPLDLFVVPGGIWHIELLWTDPAYARFMRRLASFARVITHDRPGMGASDPSPHVPTLEDRMADILAVMSAADCERAVILGISEGGPTAAMFAATYPDRVRSLIMYGTYAAGDKAVRNDDYPWAQTEALWSSAEETIMDHFGEGWSLEIFSTHRSASALERRLWATYERSVTSPSMARKAVEHSRAIDVRAVLPTISVPTLVTHRVGDLLPIEGARYIAGRIPGARLVELPGEDHIPWLGDADTLADQIEEFVTGTPAQQQPGRVLATILFTDIVGSTSRAAELGDAAWRQLLERHDALVDRTVTARGGRVVKHNGDGLLATFDGPARAIRCAQAIVGDVPELSIEVRAGLHTGECERVGDDVAGMAVHVGARVGALAGPGDVLVSSTVKELVLGSGISFEDRGIHELKGVPGSWRLFAVSDCDERREPSPQAEPRTSDRVLTAVSRRAPRLGRGLMHLARRGRSR